MMAERLQRFRRLWSRYARPARLASERAADWLMGRTPRERVMLAAAFVLVIATFWQQSLFTPAASRLSGLNSQIRSLESQQDQLQTNVAQLERRRAMADDPDQPVREDIAALQTQLAELNGALVDRGLDFIATIPMQEAMQRLQQTIASPEAPRLISFERRPGSGISTTSAEAATGLDIRHRELRVVIEGDFAQTVAFLESLEDKETQLVWRSLDYEVTDHPRARVAVRFDLYAPATFE